MAVLSICFLIEMLEYNKDTSNRAGAHMQRKGSLNCVNTLQFLHVTCHALCSALAAHFLLEDCVFRSGVNVAELVLFEGML